METNPIDSPDCEPLTAEAWQQELAAQRTRAEQMLAAQSASIDEIEQELVSQLEQLSSEMVQVSEESDHDRQEWRERAITLEQQLHEAQRIKTLLLSQQETWQQVQTQLEAEQQRRIARLDEEQQRLREQSDELEARERELVGQQAKLDVTLTEATTTQEHYQERLAKLDEERGELADLKDETRRQRRRIAKEFRQERTALQQQLAEARSQAEKAAASAGAAELAAENALASRVDEKAVTDWQRKYGMAMDELRVLRAEHEALRSRSAGASGSGAPPVAMPSGGFDWEAEKQRMISELDSGHDASDPASGGDRLAIEDVIRRTDDIIAAKDQEIARLERELEEQREASKSQVSNADELEQLVDADELIQQERAHLEELQQQLQAKLRKAEVDLSMERAKIARERAELEEMANAISAGTESAGEAPEDGKSPRGRWLSRLGLTSEDEE